MKRRRLGAWGPMIFLWGAVALVFASSLQASFQFDDHLFLNDSNVRSPGGWRHLHHGSLTRWFSWLTFRWNFRAAGEDPFWYHLVNLLLHLANVGLVYILAKPLTTTDTAFAKPAGGSDTLGAVFAAAVFGLHPLQTEAVNYVYQRTVLLAGLFGFAGLYFFFRYLAGRRLAIVGTVVCFILAMLSKESAAGFVPVFLMAFAFSQWSAKFHAYAIAATAVLLMAVLAWVLDSGFYLLTQTVIFWRYVTLFFYPVGLNIDHDFPLLTAINLPAAIAILAIAYLVVRFIRLRTCLPAAVFWFFTFLFLLLPTSSVIAVTDTMFEHRMYMPMLGLAGIAGIAFEKLQQHRRVAVLAAGAAVLVLCSYLSIQRNRQWQTEISLWESAVELSPDKFRPHYNLGTALLDVDARRAANHLRVAATLQPDSLQVWHNLGEALARSADDAGAVAAWQQGLAVYPQSVALRRALGALHSRNRNFPVARQHLLEAMRLDPRSHATFYQLALLFYRFGLPEEARPYAERALELNPADRETRQLIAVMSKARRP